MAWNEIKLRAAVCFSLPRRKFAHFALVVASPPEQLWNLCPPCPEINLRILQLDLPRQRKLEKESTYILHQSLNGRVKQDWHHHIQLCQFPWLLKCLATTHAGWSITKCWSWWLRLVTTISWLLRSTNALKSPILTIAVIKPPFWGKLDWSFKSLVIFSLRLILGLESEVEIHLHNEPTGTSPQKRLAFFQVDLVAKIPINPKGDVFLGSVTIHIRMVINIDLLVKQWWWLAPN